MELIGETAANKMHHQYSVMNIRIAAESEQLEKIEQRLRMMK